MSGAIDLEYPGFWPIGFANHSPDVGREALIKICLELDAVLVLPNKKEVERLFELHPKLKAVSIDMETAMVVDNKRVYLLDPRAAADMLWRTQRAAYEKGVRWAIETMQVADARGEKPEKGFTGTLWAQWLKNKRVAKRIKEPNHFPDHRDVKLEEQERKLKS